MQGGTSTLFCVHDACVCARVLLREHVQLCERVHLREHVRTCARVHARAWARVCEQSLATSGEGTHTWQHVKHCTAAACLRVAANTGKSRASHFEPEHLLSPHQPMHAFTPTQPSKLTASTLLFWLLMQGHRQPLGSWQHPYHAWAYSSCPPDHHGWGSTAWASAYCNMHEPVDNIWSAARFQVHAMPKQHDRLSYFYKHNAHSKNKCHPGTHEATWMREHACWARVTVRGYFLVQDKPHNLHHIISGWTNCMSMPCRTLLCGICMIGHKHRAQSLAWAWHRVLVIGLWLTPWMTAWFTYVTTASPST